MENLREPLRGEVWLARLDPVVGREQAGTRPVLVLSPDHFNRGRHDLVVVASITRADRGIFMHVPIEPPEGGVRDRSFIMCEQVRSISRERLIKSWGAVSPAVLDEVSTRLRHLFVLP